MAETFLHLNNYLHEAMYTIDEITYPNNVLHNIEDAPYCALCTLF